MQRTVGCGEQMAKMTFTDLETRLGVRDPMHRKKLFLAMTARQVFMLRMGNLASVWRTASH